MKPLNQAEIQNIVQELQTLAGARFQNIIANDNEYGFEIYQNGSVFWLYLSLDSQLPLLLKTQKINIKKKTTPLTLFLNAHGVGKRLREINFLPEQGRILFLKWGTEEQFCNFEIRLFPHGQNLIIVTPEKQISWAKVKDLPTGESKKSFEKIRTWGEIQTEYLNRKSKPVENNIEAALAKKIKTLKSIKQNISSDNKWQALGEWLKQNQSLRVPEEWANLVDKKANLSKNIQNAFSKSKQFEVKQKGMLERIKILEDEIEKLKNTEPAEEANTKENLLFKLKIKGQRIPLENNAEAYIGKSAQDNINLLRKAKAWDYWLHLKDYPSAHGFIKRNKNQNIPREDIEKVAKAVAEKSKITNGESFDVILTECRFVKPIKGDKLGRVSYKNEVSFVFKM